MDADSYTPALVLGLNRFFANEHIIVTPEEKLARRKTAMAIAIKKLPRLAVLYSRPDLEPPTMDRLL